MDSSPQRWNINASIKIAQRWENKRNDNILKLLEYNSKAVFVDLGCGNGEFTIKAKKKVGTSEVFGIDYDIQALKESKIKGIQTIQADLNNKLNLDDSQFDVCLANQLIEHVNYPISLLMGIEKILKPGGYALISTENLSSWDNIFALSMGYTPFSMEFDSGLQKIGNPFSPHEKRIKDASYLPHVRIFSWKGLIEAVKFSGLTVERVVGNGNLFGTLGETIDSRHCRYITVKARK